MDPAPVVQCVPASGSEFSVGETVVTCTATDEWGNEASASFKVTVELNTARELDLPADMTVEATGPGGAEVSYTVGASDAEDGELVPYCDPPSGSTFPLDVTTVECSVADRWGLTASGAFTVSVVDSTAPQLAGVSEDLSVSTTNPAGVEVSYELPTASDEVDPAPVVQCVPASGSEFSVGETAVTCTATDQSGNQASASFMVTVELLNTAPELDLPADMSVEASGAEGAVVSYTVGASDPEDGELVPYCDPPSGSTFPLDVTTVECSVADRWGLTALGAFTVGVVDSTPPVMADVPDDIRAFATSTNGAVVTYTPPTAIDLVDGELPVECLLGSGSQFPINQTEVICTATDSEGNESFASFVVWVTYEAPTDGSFFRNPFTDGCSATPAAQAMDGAEVNHDPRSLKPCASRSRKPSRTRAAPSASCTSLPPSRRSAA